MTLLIISIVFAVIVFIGTMIWGIYDLKENDSKGGFFTLLFTLIPFLLLIFGTFTKVNANEVGIIYDDRAGVLEEVKLEGFQSKSIFEHITKISTTNRTSQITVAGQTNDSAYADFVVTIVYRIDSENAGKFYKRTSATDISVDQLTSSVKEALQSSTIKCDIYSILGDKLEEVRIDFVNNLKLIMSDRYSITLISASFDDIDAGERIENIIKNKAEALQLIEIAEAQKQQAEVDKQTALIKAQQNAETEKIKANAEAEIVKIAAQAEADKTKIEKQAIADAIQVYIDTNGLTAAEATKLYEYIIWVAAWDGDVPTVTDGSTGYVVLP